MPRTNSRRERVHLVTPEGQAFLQRSAFGLGIVFEALEHLDGDGVLAMTVVCRLQLGRAMAAQPKRESQPVRHCVEIRRMPDPALIRFSTDQPIDPCPDIPFLVGRYGGLPVYAHVGNLSGGM